MTAIAATTPRSPAATSPPVGRRMLWIALAFSLGALSGAGIVLAVESDRSSGAGARSVVTDAEPQITAGVASTRSGSADALERVAQRHQEDKAAGCTRLPASADAVERCMSAGG